VRASVDARTASAAPAATGAARMGHPAQAVRPTDAPAARTARPGALGSAGQCPTASAVPSRRTRPDGRSGRIDREALGGRAIAGAPSAPATGRVVPAARQATGPGQGRAVTSIVTGTVRSGAVTTVAAALLIYREFPTASPRTRSPGR